MILEDLLLGPGGQLHSETAMTIEGGTYIVGRSQSNLPNTAPILLTGARTGKGRS